MAAEKLLIDPEFVVETDHKTLVSLLSQRIWKSYLVNITISVIKYHFLIRHVPVNELNTVDYLFRLPIPLNAKRLKNFKAK